jgi:hypothetical protein
MIRYCRFHHRQERKIEFLLEWCWKNSEIVCNKANVLYKKYASGEKFAGRERGGNFSYKTLLQYFT